MIERRRCLRFSIELPAWYRKPKSREFSDSVTLDISATGICCVVKEEIPRGTELTMRIKLPPKEVILINTKVIWVESLFGAGAQEYRIGVKIMEPIRFDEKKFVKFCAKIMLDLFRTS